MLMSVLWQTKNICKTMSIAEYDKNRLPLWPNWVKFFLLKINKNQQKCSTQPTRISAGGLEVGGGD